MKNLDIIKVLINVLFVMLGAPISNAEILMDVFVKQDGYRCHISVSGQYHPVTIIDDMMVLILSIDNDVIEDAITSGGVLKIPEEITYNGKSYEINGMKNVLRNIKGLKTVILPKHMISMESCLEGCADLTTICFNECFEACFSSINNLPSLTSLDFPESFVCVGEASLNGLPIKEMDMRHIGDVRKSSCGGWPNVTRLEFPSEFGSAEKSTFGGMPNLEEIVLPEVVEGCLSPNMFSGCANVRRIYARSIIPPSLGEWGKPGNIIQEEGYGEGFFSDDPTGIDKSKCVLYVPEGSATAYRENEYWGRFKNIVERDYGGVVEVSVGGGVIDRLRVADGKISVPGSGEPVTVSDLNGRCVYQGGTAVDAEVAVSPGIYVVRVGGDVRKVSVR